MSDALFTYHLYFYNSCLVPFVDPESFNKLYAYYDTITPETIIAVANKYFTDDRLATLTLAYAEDVLPTPPAPVLDGANALAGSVDGFVEAVTKQDVFEADQVIIPSNSSKLVYFGKCILTTNKQCCILGSSLYTHLLINPFLCRHSLPSWIH